MEELLVEAVYHSFIQVVLRNLEEIDQFSHVGVGFLAINEVVAKRGGLSFSDREIGFLWHRINAFWKHDASKMANSVGKAMIP